MRYILKEDTNDQVLRCSLTIDMEDGTAVLDAYDDENGHECNIAYLGNDGCLHLIPGVDSNLPFKLDAENRIKVIKDK